MNDFQDKEVKDVFESLSKSIPAPESKATFKKELLEMVDQTAQNQLTTEATQQKKPILSFGIIKTRLRDIAVAATAFLTLLGSIAYASGGSLPGAPLYPVKKMIETTQSALTLNPNVKARRHVGLIETRLDEFSNMQKTTANKKYIAKQVSSESEDLSELWKKLSSAEKGRLTTELEKTIKIFSFEMNSIDPYLTENSKIFLDDFKPEQQKPRETRTYPSSENSIYDKETDPSGETETEDGDGEDISKSSGEKDEREDDTQDEKSDDAESISEDGNVGNDNTESENEQSVTTEKENTSNKEEPHEENKNDEEDHSDSNDDSDDSKELNIEDDIKK